MRAFILAGGKGSRLRPFTFTIPKPLVPIGDVPIIEILIRQLVAAGYDRITISVGYMASLVQGYCGDGSRWGVDLDYVVEEEPLGTAGCLALLDDFADDRLLVVNGDTLTDLDLAEAYRLHDPADGITICANRRTVDIDFGVIETDPEGMLTAYREKPTLSYQVSIGVNVVSRWVIERYLDVPRRIDMPDVVRTLMTDGHGVRVYEPDAFWLDLGRMEDLEEGVRVFQADPKRFLPE